MRVRSFAVGLSIVAAVGLAATAYAALAPSKASQLVTVYTTGGCPIPGSPVGNSGAFTQMVRADGSTVPFAVPAKRIFVMTDVTMTAASEPAGDAIFALLAVGTAAGGSPVSTRFETVASSGTVTATFAFPTGIAIKGSSTACIQMFNQTHFGSVFPSAIAHGFFASDK